MFRVDPIRTNYFDAVEAMDRVSSILFYIGAALSFAVLSIDRTEHPGWYEASMIAFGLVSASVIVVGLVLRLYLIPRAEDKRRQDLFSNATGVSLSNERTDGYYNNSVKDPMLRLAALTLENSFFSKIIALRMLRVERVKILTYLVVWFTLLYSRKTDIGWIVAASQAVLSEDLLAKWLRLEWLRTRCERAFDDLYAQLRLSEYSAAFQAHTLAIVTRYETSKSNAAVTLSSRIFEQLNPSLSAQWDAIRADLKI